MNGHFQTCHDAVFLRHSPSFSGVLTTSATNIVTYKVTECQKLYDVCISRFNINNLDDKTMPESQNTEWKSKWKDDYLEWICGYANAQGGKIYIGFDDNGNIIGLPNAHKLLEDIPNKIRDAMGIIVGVNLLEKDGKEYIEIDVPAYPIGISYKGIYYYRSGSTRQILTGPALEAFLMQSAVQLGTIFHSQPFL